MASKSYKASAPGSLMLFGEHAVLHGSQAIVYAIDKHITVTLLSRSDRIIHIKAAKFGEHKFKISNFAVKPPFQFVLTAIAKYLPNLPSGFDLLIKSEFAENIGLGSSAAVTVATLKVLQEWLKLVSKPMQLVKEAREIVQKVQGVGSGADVAASVFGGVIVYKMNPLKIKRLTNKPPLTVVYSGKKTPTAEVIHKVAALQKRHPQLFAALYQLINQCVTKAISAINSQNWPKLGGIMNIHQGLQDAMGVNNEALAALIFNLRQDSHIYGAKISGSGLGDCVIGLGQARRLKNGLKQLNFSYYSAKFKK